MSKHTKGPWRILPEEYDKPYMRIRGMQLGGRYKVANVHRMEPTSSPILDARDAAETLANASLIAAAPDLLEILIDFASSPSIAAHHPKRLAKALAAIAKAEGEQP